MKDVSPALKILAADALPGSDRRTRKRILAAIRNTVNALADPASIKDAEYADREASAEADAESINASSALYDPAVDQPFTGIENTGWATFRPRIKRRFKLAGRREIARRIIPVLNEMLRSIGRQEI